MVSARPRHLTAAREALADIMAAAIAAVEPEQAVRRHLRLDGRWLMAAGSRIDLSTFDRILLVGAGKATAPMARAVETLLGTRITNGTIVVKTGHGLPLERVVVREATHPVPDPAALAAGAEVLSLVQEAGARDLVICLISGGASALLESLPPPLTLESLQQTTTLLLRAGATIDEMNAVRKHLSEIKGGQLARAAAPATVLTLVLSDVVGSPLDVIGSGPTVPDPSRWADVQAVVHRCGIGDALPDAVRRRIAAGQRGEIPETPKPGDALVPAGPVHVIADNALAANAAAAAAEQRGFRSLVLTTYLEGEARELGRVAVALGREILHHDRPVPRPACLILGGESTVTVTGSGRGGRNQELALAAAIQLVGREGVIVGTLATDGSDGPTDGAGAIVDAHSVARAAALALDATAHLAANDAYPWLDAAGDLLRTGPTRTNVNDLLFILVP